MSATGTREPAARRTVRVLVVDDDAVSRRLLSAAVDAAPDLVVVGEARNGREALSQVVQLSPDAVVMDLDLPGMNGLEAIEAIMASHPTPIVVVSAFVGADGTQEDPNAATALAAGAVDVVPKPAGVGDVSSYPDLVCRRLRMASRIKVITHPRGRLRPRPVDVAAVPGRLPTSARTAEVRVVVIGASTGGPPALAAVLRHLPVGFAPAVLVVQHMAQGFVEGLASWLDGSCPLPVGVGAGGRRLVSGTVTIAPTGLDLQVREGLRLVCEAAPAEQIHVPSIDTAMFSVAASVGAGALGVLLTGMGRDGAAGLLALHQRGGWTLAQDEATSAVYGMPAAAVALGAVDRQLPLPRIGPALLEAVRARGRQQGDLERARGRG